MGKHIKWFFLIIAVSIALSSCDYGVFSSLSYNPPAEKDSGNGNNGTGQDGENGESSDKGTFVEIKFPSW